MDWRLRNVLYDVIMLASATSLPEGKEDISMNAIEASMNTALVRISDAN